MRLGGVTQHDLGHQLRAAIRRNRRELLDVFGDRADLGDTVNGRGRGEDEMRDLGLHGDRKQRARLARVVEIIAERVGNRFRDHDRSREMDDGVDRIAAEQPAHEGMIADISPDEFCLGRYRPAKAGRQIVENEYVLAGIEQLEHHMAADEASPTRYEHTH
jgi:hypothetical protein